MGSLAVNERRRFDGSLVLTVGGIVDDRTVECFEKALDRVTDAGPYPVIVDLTACRLDSAGLAALVRLWRRSRGGFAVARLVVPDFASFRMLQLLGLTSQFETYRTMDAALRLRSATPSRERSKRMVARRPAMPTGPRDGAIRPRRTPSTNLDGAAFPFRAVQRTMRAVRLGSRGGRR